MTDDTTYAAWRAGATLWLTDADDDTAMRAAIAALPTPVLLRLLAERPDVATDEAMVNAVASARFERSGNLAYRDDCVAVVRALAPHFAAREAAAVARERCAAAIRAEGPDAD